MKINKNKISLIIIIILMLLAYILFAIKPIKSNIQLEPVWTMNITNAEKGGFDNSFLPFKLGENFGYFTQDKKVCLHRILEDNEMATITEDVYAVYNNNSLETEFHFVKDGSSSLLKKAGFPFFEKDRLFMMFPNGSGFSKHDKNGYESWSFEYYCPITSFQSNEKSVAVGFSDGVIIVFDYLGNIKQKIQPAGSEYEVILGTAISKSGKYVGCISGINKQRLVLVDISENMSKIIYHEYVDSETTEQRLVQFSQNEQYVFLNEKEYLVAVEIEEKKSTRIPVKGKILQIKEAYDGEFYFVLSKDLGTSTVHLLNKNMYCVGEFSFDDESSFIETDNENLYVGNGQEISKIRINVL